MVGRPGVLQSLGSQRVRHDWVTELTDTNMFRKLLFSPLVVFDSLWPHGLQDFRLPSSSPYPRICSDSLPLSWWWHPTISSSVTLFSSCPQSFPASRAFPMSWFFTSGGHSIRAWVSVTALSIYIQDQFPLWLIGLSPCIPREFRESSQAPQFQSIDSSACRLLYDPLWFY